MIWLLTYWVYAISFAVLFLRVERILIGVLIVILPALTIRRRDRYQPARLAR